MNTITRIPQIQFAIETEKLESFRQSVKIGADIHGRVIQSFGNDQYLVSMRGMNLIAESNLPLKNGDNFRAKVQAVEPRLLLKITDDAAESQKLAEQWNVKGDDRKIVSEMMAARLPMTKESFERIKAVVQQYRHHPQLKASYEELARAAIKLEQMNLPPSLDNLKGALLAVKSNFDMALVMANLKFFLGNDKSELPPELLRFMQNLPARFDPQMLARNLPAAIHLLGLLHEAGLKDLLEGKIPKKLNLKWLMLALEKGGNELPNEQSSGLNDLEALQFRNLPESRAAETDSAYLQLPIYYQGEWERMDVFFRDHGGNQKQLDKNNASIRISFDSRNLGKISALTDIQNGALTIDLNFENPIIADFIRPFMNELQEAIAALGYDVRSVTASTHPIVENQTAPVISAFKKSEGFNFIA